MDNMKADTLKEIITSLEEEEVSESKLITLYLALLDAGAEYCLPFARRLEFRNKVKLLAEQSQRHKAIVGELIAKYAK